MHHEKKKTPWPLRARNVSIDEVWGRLERRLAWYGVDQFKLGDVKEAGRHAIVAEIVARDGSLVRRLEVNRFTGSIRFLD